MREREEEKGRETVILKGKEELRREVHQASVLPLELYSEKFQHSDHEVNRGLLRHSLRSGRLNK